MRFLTCHRCDAKNGGGDDHLWSRDVPGSGFSIDGVVFDDLCPRCTQEDADMKVIEKLCADGVEPRVAQAQSTLVRCGAQFVEAALADNPDGPVSMETTISRTDVDYSVVIGDPSDSMSPKSARCIWHKTVTFGHTDRTVAGGAAFVEAAREQERVAWAALEVMESRR